VGNDAEQHGPAGRKHDRVVAGQLFAEDQNGEDDGRQPARAEPPDEEPIRRTGSRADQAQKDRKHPDHGQAQHCEDRRRR